VTTTPARRVDSREALSQPGDYALISVRVGEPDDERRVPYLACLLPISSGDQFDDRAGHGLIMLPLGGDSGWTFTEHPDGSVSVQPSILVHGKEGDPDAWHGYLEPGNVWREC